MQETSSLPSIRPAPLRDLIWLFLGTRLLLVICTFLSFILFPVPPHVYPEAPVDLGALVLSWNHWDAAIYVNLARSGYHNPANAAFFPLFPLLIKGSALLFGNHAYELAAMLISNLALFGTLYMLYQIATDALGEAVGRRTLLYLCIFPTAFFFFAGYNESLFLFLTCSTLFSLRCQKWLLAGVLGLLTALTRTAGILLIFPFLYEVWTARASSQPISGQLKSLLLKGLPMLLIIAGLACYSLYCWKHFGDPLAFLAAEKSWGKTTTFPWYGILYSFWQIFFHQPFGSFIEVHILLDLSATLGFILLTILGARRLRPTYTIWTTVLFLAILCSSSLTEPDAIVSNQRYVLEMFPAFIMLAALGIKHPRLHQGLVLAFPFLQALMAALFVLNRWMI